MGFLDFFKKRKKSDEDSEFSAFADKLIAESMENDFLGKAAEAGQKARAALKEGKYDEAWAFYHEQKSLYMQHANRCGFTARQVLALDSSVHERLANILRLEGKHQDALVHIVYWVLGGAERPVKAHQQKLQSYFNRCKFKNISLTEARKVISSQQALPEFTLAKSIVTEWINRG